MIKEILNCGLGYNHIKKENERNYYRAGTQDGWGNSPDFEVNGCDPPLIDPGMRMQEDRHLDNFCIIRGRLDIS